MHRDALDLYIEPALIVSARAGSMRRGRKAAYPETRGSRPTLAAMKIVTRGCSVRGTSAAADNAGGIGGWKSSDTVPLLEIYAYKSSIRRITFGREQNSLRWKVVAGLRSLGPAAFSSFTF